MTKLGWAGRYVPLVFQVLTGSVGQDGSFIAISTSTSAPFVCHHGGSPGNNNQEWCNCADGSTTAMYKTSVSSYPYTYSDGEVATVKTLCPYTARPDSSLLFAPIESTTTLITAPLTRGGATPTTAIPVHTATCTPGNYDDGSSNFDHAAWSWRFLYKSLDDFCQHLDEHSATANDQANNWWYKEYTPGLNSTADAVPVDIPVAFYIHYEKMACPADWAEKTVKIGGEGSISCQDSFGWLWKTGCQTTIRYAGGLATEEYWTGMGYYNNCMWWSILDPKAVKLEARGLNLFQRWLFSSWL